MKGPLVFAAFAAVLASVASAPVAGQKMYRCGNNYQDRPCDSGQKGRVVGSTGTGSAASSSAAAPGSMVSPAAAVECAQRGKDSMKAVWARESGATQDRALSEASSEAERVAVRDAWKRPGAASVVARAVEADCLAAKDKEARAAILMDEALKARKDAGLPAPAAPAATPVADEKTRDESLQREMDARNAEMKRRNCARMERERESLETRARRGGNAAAMERFAEERRALDKRVRAEGC